MDHALRLIGPTTGPEPLLAAADLFVSASWAESFPYNVLEAMAASLAVVATDVGGTGEAVADGVTGVLVPPRDAEALASAISGLLDDPSGRERLGRAGRVRQLELFTVDRMVDDTIGVYRGRSVYHRPTWRGLRRARGSRERLRGAPRAGASRRAKSGSRSDATSTRWSATAG